MVWTPGKAIPPPSTLLTDAKKSGFAPIDIRPAHIPWEEWQARSRVYVWEAVALSCEIFPTTVFEASAALNGRDYDYRLPIVLAEVGSKIRSIVPNVDGRKHFDSVLLKDVMNFCISCNCVNFSAKMHQIS